MKTFYKELLLGCLAAVVLIIIALRYFPQPETSPLDEKKKQLPSQPRPARLAIEDGRYFPFSIDMTKAEQDKYFGPAVAYDPNDETMKLMRHMMLGLAEAMDNPKHPCNPLVSANAKIIGMNIKPLNHGDKTYTMWVSDGTTTCGMEVTHFEGWVAIRSKEIFLRDFTCAKWLADLAITPKPKPMRLSTRIKKVFGSRILVK